MSKVRAAVIASILAFSSFAGQSADLSMVVSGHHDEALMNPGNAQNHMFDGINLTERQRQQMRDLMRRARDDSPPVNVSEIETMYSLVTAEHFDEVAVRSLTEKVMQDRVARQVEMAKVRNQMYRLLTPEQQHALTLKHQQRMKAYRELSERQQSYQLRAVSSPRSN